MREMLAHLFTPRGSNNYKAKALQLSSLSSFLLLIIVGQLLITVVGRAVPGVLGIASSISAADLVNLTNAKRAELGLPTLSVNQALANAASLKASDMMAKNYWSHTSPDGTTPWYFFGASGYSYLYAGENLARDFMDSGSVVSAWMNSPTHKANIVSPRYHDIGIAVVSGNFMGQETTLVVQMFGTPASAQVAQVAVAEVATEETATPIAIVGAEPTEEIATPEQVTVALIDQPRVAGLYDRFPFLNSFQLTRAMSLSLTLLLLALIVIDAVVITRKKITRLSGKSLAHFIFLGILLLILLFVKQGLIL